MPKDHLRTCMDYEADRMQNLVLTDEVVAPEREVVLEERRMRTDSDPGDLLSEAVQSALFTPPSLWTAGDWLGGRYRRPRP